MPLPHFLFLMWMAVTLGDAYATYRLLRLEHVNHRPPAGFLIERVGINTAIAIKISLTTALGWTLLHFGQLAVLQVLSVLGIFVDAWNYTMLLIKARKVA